MKSKTMNIAKALASQLPVAEEAVDTAMQESANLVEACISSRRAVGASTVMGTDVHKHVLLAMAKMNEAQSDLKLAHQSLSHIGESMGLPITAAFPLPKEPPAILKHINETASEQNLEALTA